MYRIAFIVFTFLLGVATPSLAQTPVRGATFLPIVIDDNRVVIDTFDETDNLRVGDILLAVNSVVLKDAGDFHRLVRNIPAHTTLRVRVKRLGQELQVELVTSERPLNRLTLPMRNQSGLVVRPEKWRGITLVYVWSIHCHVCTRMAPEVFALAQKHTDLRFVAISPDPWADQRRTETAKLLDRWPLLYDGMGQLNSLIILDYPTFIVLEGTEIRATFRGRSEFPKLKRMLAKVTPSNVREGM